MTTKIKKIKEPWNRQKAKREFAKLIYKTFFYSLIFGLCFIILYPLLKILPSVFSDMSDLGNPDVVWIPKKFSVLSFKAAGKIILGGTVTRLVLTILYALSIMVIQVVMSSMAGYALARVNFRGNKIIFMLVILTFLVPPQALLISQYLHFKQFDVFGIFQLITGGTIDITNKSYILYILAFLGLGVKQGLFVFIFRQFFMTMPKEFEEASSIDGCGFNRTYFKIMFPNAMPPIMTVGILSFVWNYGDVYYTNYFHPSGPYLSTLLQKVFDPSQKDAINNILFSQYNIFLTGDLTFEATKQAALIIFLIPLLVVYFIAQKNLIQSLERSGIVG